CLGVIKSGPRTLHGQHVSVRAGKRQKFRGGDSDARAPILHNRGAMTPSSRFAILFLTIAVISAACSDSELPTSPSPDGDTVGYTVLGASDGLGVGGSVVCAPFDLGCENGTGYAQRLRRRFESDGKTVLYNNLSAPGYVLAQA